MAENKFDKIVSVDLPIGHLLFVWHVLANKLPDTNYKDKFSDEEKRALWALEDLFENTLTKNKVKSRPEKEWNQLIDKAREFIKTLPAEFLD